MAKLRDLQQGDVFEAGALLGGAAPDQLVVWEVVKRREPPAGGVLLHLDGRFGDCELGRYAVKVEEIRGKEAVLWHKMS